MARESETARARGAQGWIQRLLNLSLNNTSITTFLRERGLSYRNQNMLSDINRARVERQLAASGPRIGPGEVVPADRLETIKGRPDYPYRAIVTGEWRNPTTGEITKRSMTLHFSRLFSQSDVFAELESMHDLYLEQEGYTFSRATEIRYYKVDST